MDSGTKALLVILSAAWEDVFPLDILMFNSFLLAEAEDDRDAFECTKELRPDSLLELLFELLPESLLAFVEDLLTTFPIDKVFGVAGCCFPFHRDFFGADVRFCCTPSESAVPLELLKLPLSLASWLGIMCISGFPILAVQCPKCFRLL
jgi:hypothetical protein